jgi:hypothetical protein
MADSKLWCPIPREEWQRTTLKVYCEDGSIDRTCIISYPYALAHFRGWVKSTFPWVSEFRLPRSAHALGFVTRFPTTLLDKVELFETQGTLYPCGGTFVFEFVRSVPVCPSAPCALGWVHPLKRERVRAIRGRFRTICIAIIFTFRIALSHPREAEFDGPNDCVLGPIYWDGFYRSQEVARFMLYTWSAVVTEGLGASDSEEVEMAA